MDSKRVFEILVREHSDMLTTYLRAVVWDSSAAEDLFQDTMLVAWRKLDDFDRSRPFGPWLRGIASRLVMAHYRKSKRSMMVCNEAVLIRLDDLVHEIGQRPGDTWDDKIDELRECIENLPAQHREVIDLHYKESSSTKEMAAKLEVSLEAVKKRLQRARGQVRLCLETKGVIPEATS